MKDRQRPLSPLRPSPARPPRSGKLLTVAIPLIVLSTIPVLIASRPSSFNRIERRTEEILAGMDVTRKVSQLFMLPVNGSSALGREERAFLGEAQPGAIILFGFNLQNGNAAARAFTASIQDAMAEGPLPALIAVDHEGGSVFRFRNSLTFLPSASVQGSKLNTREIEALARISGAQLRALGISVNLAPIVEPLQSWNSGFLGDRSYSSDPLKAANCASAFARGMRSSGLAATLKHFPGNAAEDPHKGLPVLSLDKGGLKRFAITPFKRAIASSKADIVMLSHAKVPALDPDRPASLSPAVVDCLRRDLSFKGVVLTDDLEMGALSTDRSVGQSALAAFRAGADMLMLTSRAGFPAARRELLAALDSGLISSERLDGSARRIIRLKLSLGLMAERDPSARKTGFGALAELLEEGSKYVNDRLR